jgi:hypothetical protein
MVSHEKHNVKDVLKKLPPNYPIGTLYVNGAAVIVVTFVNYMEGLAYFIGEDCQVVIIDVDSIDGIQFAPTEVEEEED